ncbi:Arrestin domain-containing protein 3 [Trichoplax sp. H2]|nr:Arrestin domain-containing protein 3 [Trichoplax sp. H2]|eukprot:RDD40082.1 Arrestin domain-containing protein 3 [Trichoplax sp. H2]
MGKLTLFEIQLENPKANYYKGDIINGTIKIQIQVAMPALGLSIRLRGRASAASRSKHGCNVDHYFLDEKQTIWGDASDQVFDSRHSLPAGYHEFKFTNQLNTDDDMPSSFDSRPYCIIFYGIVAQFERPPSKNYTCETGFTYIQTVDVPRPLLREQPSQLRLEQPLNRFLCQFGTVKLSIKADRSGYLPGETMLLNIECENSSNVVLKGIQVALVRRVLASVEGNFYKYYDTIVALESDQPVDRGKTFNLNDESFDIPHIPPAISYRRIIKAEYSVQVTVLVPKAKNLIMRLPITIGSLTTSRPDNFPRGHSIDDVNPVILGDTHGIDAEFFEENEV